jgi:hypothetical protein
LAVIAADLRELLACDALPPAISVEDAHQVLLVEAADVRAKPLARENV